MVMFGFCNWAGRIKLLVKPSLAMETWVIQCERSTVWEKYLMLDIYLSYIPRKQNRADFSDPYILKSATS